MFIIRRKTIYLSTFIRLLTSRGRITIPDKKFIPLSLHRKINYTKDIYYLISSSEYLLYLHFNYLIHKANCRYYQNLVPTLLDKNPDKYDESINSMKEIEAHQESHLKNLLRHISLEKRLINQHKDMPFTKSGLFWISDMNVMAALFFNQIACYYEKEMVAKISEFSGEELHKFRNYIRDEFKSIHSKEIEVSVLHLWYKNLTIPLIFSVERIKSLLKVTMPDDKELPILLYRKLPAFKNNWVEDLSRTFSVDIRSTFLPEISGAFPLSLLCRENFPPLEKSSISAVSEHVVPLLNHWDETEIIITIQPFKHFKNQEFVTWIRKDASERFNYLCNMNHYTSPWETKRSHTDLGNLNSLDAVPTDRLSSKSAHLQTTPFDFIQKFISTNINTEIDSFRKCAFLQECNSNSLRYNDYDCQLCGLNTSILHSYEDEYYWILDDHFHYRIAQLRCPVFKKHNVLHHLGELFFRAMLLHKKDMSEMEKSTLGFYSKLLMKKPSLEFKKLYYNEEDFHSQGNPQYYDIGIRMNFRDCGTYPTIKEFFELFSYLCYVVELVLYFDSLDPGLKLNVNYGNILITYSLVFTGTTNWRKFIGSAEDPREIINKIVSSQEYYLGSGLPRKKIKGQTIGNCTYNPYLNEMLLKMKEFKEKLKEFGFQLDIII